MTSHDRSLACLNKEPLINDYDVFHQIDLQLFQEEVSAAHPQDDKDILIRDDPPPAVPFLESAQGIDLNAISLQPDPDFSIQREPPEQDEYRMQNLMMITHRQADVDTWRHLFDQPERVTIQQFHTANQLSIGQNSSTASFSQQNPSTIVPNNSREPPNLETSHSCQIIQRQEENFQIGQYFDTLDFLGNNSERSSGICSSPNDTSVGDSINQQNRLMIRLYQRQPLQ
ncbi:hypothetical protein FGO68_gene10793 [Halteria grandinella]|uniref:Uncharacterized protein n=1 Tax=Halteria grandinella TaxID=5974 RepID=A0A8J8NQL4_HALGN|nr:hypothetical protein FGO68_gene10793 [Halteria grandinella]